MTGTSNDAVGMPAPAQQVERPTVLIVDDAPQSLTVLGELLASAYRVRVANSGRRGLELASLEPLPDLILLDVMMQDMNGYEVLSRLRAQEDTRDIPVIFITALDGIEDEQHGLDLGATDYIVKPYRPPIVLARVHTHLELKRVRDQLRAQNLALAAEVDERRRSEATIRALNESLQRAVANLEAFSYSVSHDLRAPLRTMSGFAHLLVMDLESGALDKVSDHARRISANAERMGKLIDGLLAVARIAHTELNQERVDMNGLVDNILAEQDIGDHVLVDIGRLHTIHADASAMRQAWTNLLTNAIKYSSKHPRPEIVVRCEVRDGEVDYSVRDNGAGFDPRFAEKLFGVFQRLHGADEFDGTGIGLAIVKSVAELHGGRVWAEGKVGAGATFHMALPVDLVEFP